MPVVIRKFITLSKLIWLNVIDLFVMLSGRKFHDNLLIVRVDAIGDYVLFRNFLQCLKNSRFGAYKITLCGNIVWKDLCIFFDSEFIDDFIWIDRNRLYDDHAYRYSMLKQIRKKGFEIAIQPSVSPEYFFCEAIIRAAGARENICIDGDGLNISPLGKFVSDRFYDKLIQIDGTTSFEFLRNKAFFEELLQQKLGIERPCFDAARLPSVQYSDRSYAVIFPGASEKSKQWQPSGFAEVSRYLSGKFGLAVIIAGSKDDSSLAEEIIRHSAGVNIADLTGRTTLPELARLIADSTILVSNDTSAVHFAVAVGTKAVCISSGKQYGKCHPYPDSIYRDVSYIYPNDSTGYGNSVSAHGIVNHSCPGADINTIAPNLVIVHIEKLLNS